MRVWVCVFVCGVCVVGEGGCVFLFVGCGGWCALGGLLGCCFLLFVFARCEWCGWRVFVGCEYVCVACVVGVVVWVLGVCVRGGGLPVWLLRVVWVWGLMLGAGCLCSACVGVPVSGSAPVGFSSAHVSGSGSVSAPSSVVPGCGGVRVCSVGACGVWCFVVFFGGGVVGGGCWCGWGES